MKKYQQFDNVQPVVDVLTSAFQNDPVFNSFINKDEKKTDGLHFLFKELIPLCITPETNVWINEEENASIIWWKNDKNPLSISLTLYSLFHISHWYKAIGSLSGVYNIIRFLQLSDKEYPRFPHIYLFMIGVKQSSKQHGYGSKMMKVVTNYADQYNYPIYLECSNELNIPFYEKHGFYVLQRHRCFSNGPYYWTMMRPMKNPLKDIGSKLE